MAEIETEVRGKVGCITLCRPSALNALSLGMIRSLTQALVKWREDPSIEAVALRGSDKQGPFGAFCAGGDIRFFHAAALTGNPELEDFFTEEYTLNHLIHLYGKPVVAFLDGVVMGGGMGLTQGASHRIVTERTRMAMPETGIGLFPDVAGGYFLSRCPGRVGEYLALTGNTWSASEAITWGLADQFVHSGQLAGLWDKLGEHSFGDSSQGHEWLASHGKLPDGGHAMDMAEMDRHFSLPSVAQIVASLNASGSEWAQATANTLRSRSPLMLHVALEQVRRARDMCLSDELRMERDMVRHCFFASHLGRSGTASETVEGIRALVIDKDRTPRWNPSRMEDVTPDMVLGFFASPWPPLSHPLRHLAG